MYPCGRGGRSSQKKKKDPNSCMEVRSIKHTESTCQKSVVGRKTCNKVF